VLVAGIFLRELDSASLGLDGVLIEFTIGFRFARQDLWVASGDPFFFSSYSIPLTGYIFYRTLPRGKSQSVIEFAWLFDGLLFDVSR